VRYPDGTQLSVDAATGQVYATRIPRAVPESGRTMSGLLD
jgi:hypothetical protein